MSKDLATQIQLLADKCVKCALCSTVCPTYLVTQDEAESPRGRIALMQGLASEAFAPTPKTIKHLDHCLNCRQCEAVCPAEVEYGRLIDAGHQWLTEHTPSPDHKPHTLVSRMMMRLVRSPSRLRRWARFASYFKCFKKLSRFAAMPDLSTPKKIWAHTYLAHHETARVGLFLGCVARISDQALIKESIRLLNRCGVSVLVGNEQGCCGALHGHAGDVREAKTLAQKNAEAFQALGVETILTTASGCGSYLKDYQTLLDVTIPKVMDIQAYVVSHLQAHIDLFTFNPTDAIVAHHTPCTLKTGLKTPDAPTQLLQAIPQLNLISVGKTLGCCGAAGINMLTHPKMATDVITPLIEEIVASNATVVLTSNIGCAYHLRQHLAKTHPHVRVQHPIEFMAELIQS